jgi:hypothetical protein
MRRQVTLSQVVSAANEALVGSIYVSEPAVVVSYNPSTQRASVQPILQDVRFDPDTGQPYGEAWPVLQNVEVLWPCGGGAVLVGTLKPNDRVSLIAWDIDPSSAPVQPGSKPVMPVDVRKLSGHAWRAIPEGLTTPLSTAEAAAAAQGLLLGVIGDQAQLRLAPGSIQLGATGGDHVALAAKIDSLVDILIATYTPSGTETGFAALVAALATWKAAHWTSSTTVGSSLISAQ